MMNKEEARAKAAELGLKKLPTTITLLMEDKHTELLTNLVKTYDDKVVNSLLHCLREGRTEAQVKALAETGLKAYEMHKLSECLADGFSNDQMLRIAGMGLGGDQIGEVRLALKEGIAEADLGSIQNADWKAMRAARRAKTGVITDTQRAVVEAMYLSEEESESIYSFLDELQVTSEQFDQALSLGLDVDDLENVLFSLANKRPVAQIKAALDAGLHGSEINYALVIMKTYEGVGMKYTMEDVASVARRMETDPASFCGTTKEVNSF